MQFLQIIEITTDRIDELVRLEDEWRVAARGRRTGTADWLCAVRDQPGRYFTVNLFPSYDEAMTNGALPETNALAEQAMQLGSASFHDCDVLHDVWGDELDGQAGKLASMLATGVVPDDLFADDVVIALNIPHGREELRGIEAVRAAAPLMIPPGEVVEQTVTPAISGFALEVAIRAADGLSRSLSVARTTGGLVHELAYYCTDTIS